VLNGLAETKQSVFEGDVHVREKVVAYTLEHWVLFLLNYKHDVALNHVCDLLSLSFESNVISISHSALNFNLELLALLDQALSFTVGAVLLVDLAFAAALLTRLLHLHLHHSHVHQLQGHSLSLARTADFLLATFRSGSLAGVAVHVSLNIKSVRSADVQLFQIGFQIKLVRWPFLSLVSTPEI